MFFGTGRGEKVSVLGTPAFLDFVETIRNEGVEFETRPMGPTSPGNGPMVIEPDKSDPEKVELLDIELPKLKARIERNMLRLDELDTAAIDAPRLPLVVFTPEQQREIVFRNINTGKESHRTRLDAGGVADWRNAVGWFAKSIKDDCASSAVSTSCSANWRRLFRTACSTGVSISMIPMCCETYRSSAFRWR